MLASALAVAAVLGPAGGTASWAGTRASAGASLTSVVVPPADVLRAVQAAQTLQSVPAGVEHKLTANDVAGPSTTDMNCRSAPPNKANVPFYAFGLCTWGDLKSSKLMVMYGDSHAPMWAEALQSIALRAGWRLVTYYLWNCPAPNFTYVNFDTKSPNKQCAEFHAIAPGIIDRLHPQLVIATSEAGYQDLAPMPGVVVTPAEWKSGWTKVLDGLKGRGTRVVMIGDIPQWTNDSTYCLAAHLSGAQACADTPQQAMPYNVPAEKAAAAAAKVQYISPEPWICARECEPVIGGIRVYNDQYHLTGTYVEYLSGALQQALGLPNAKS